MPKSPEMLQALAELKTFDLPPTQVVLVQLMLGVQEFMRTQPSLAGKDFRDWTLADICLALQFEMPK